MDQHRIDRQDTVDPDGTLTLRWMIARFLPISNFGGMLLSMLFKPEI